MSKLYSAKAVIASSKTSRRLKRSAWLLSAAVAAIGLANPAHAQLAPGALPTGGDVVAGSATIGTPTPSSMSINQATDRAVMNWNSFDIGSAASVTFVQPSSTSIAVNRVTGGGAPSEIAGHLSANGRVAILNPNGVFFSGTADVNVGSLIASTGDIDQGAFMGGGNLAITGANGGEIVVNGNINITAGSLGLAAFVAPTVRNSGVITATAGRVQLGAGTAFTLDLAGDGLLHVGLGATNPLVQNNGQIFAAGGYVQLSARQASALVDQTIRTGVLPVGSARLDGGTIVLDASGQDFTVASDITGTGNVTVNANRISGAGDIDVAGALTLNVNSAGAVADTTIGSGNWINDALGVIGGSVTGTTINLGAGLYRSGTMINNGNVTLDGQGVARIGWTAGIENAVDIWGDNVTVRNLEISGPATSAFDSFAWGSTNSRGVFVHVGADNVSLIGNTIHDIRTGILIDGRNSGTVVTGNLIDNSKSGISVQYTDGSNITMTGNREGAIGNEWGINVYLNGILQPNGSLPASTSQIGGVSVGVLGAASLAEQQRILALSAANNGMAAQNIAYSSLNRTRAYVTTTGGANTQGSRLSALGSIQAGVNAVVTGGTVYVANGTYDLGSAQLSITHALSLIGASQAGVIIDGRNVSANGLGTLAVNADNVSLSNFTLHGSTLSGGNYGIKVAPNPAGHVSTAGGTNERLSNFALSNVTVSGSRRAELDMNGVTGATITNFTADGRSVATGLATDGAGIQITDSANVTLTGVHTLNNNWGGVALYQSNSASGYNAQTTNINIDAAQNVFEEANGLYTQRDSTTQGFGQLNLTGFDYAIRNTGSRADGYQFTWFQTDLARASAFALALGAPTTSSIEGYTGTGYSNVFTVIAGLGVDAAVRDARNGGTINVGAGTYSFANTLMIDKSLSLIGAGSGATIFDASALSVYGMRVHADNVTLSGFSLLAPSAASNSTYGIKVEVGAGDTNGNARIDNFAISNVAISGSRKTGLDLNAVVGATIDGVRVTGALAGNGISISDSANVTVRNTTTSGNAWGGLALYQANGATGSNQQLTGIKVEGNNSFGEANGLYLQDSSATNDVGALSIAGFDYIVRNAAFRADGSQFTFFRTSLSDATGYALSLGTPVSSSVEGWSGSAGTNGFTVVAGLGIGAAVRDARAGATINVGAGTYVENVVIAKTGISLLGAGRNLTTISGISGVGALGTVTLAAGSSNTVLSGFTINGIENNNPGSETAAVYLQQTNTGSRITGNRIVAAGDLGLVSEWGYAITGLVVDGNIIGGRTYVGAAPATGDQFTVPNVSRQLVALGGGGVGGGISFTNNVVNGDSGLNMGVTIDSAGSTISGNSFATTTGGTAASLRVRGAGASIAGNIFNTANLGATADALFLTSPVLGTSGDFAALVAANTVIGNGVWADASTSGDHSLTVNIAKAVTEAATGTNVHVLDGTYVLAGQLALTRSVNLIGQSQAGTILDGRTVNDGGGLGTIMVAADNTALRNFTLLGSQMQFGNYGIKVAPNPLGYTPTGGPDQRIGNVTISDVTVRGSRRAELDINGAIGVTVNNFTADGQNTDGAGVQITDSADVTLTGVHTLGNNWGGVALYQTNRAGGYNAQTTNININAAQNQFEEANGLFAQLESTTQGFGQLNLTGYGYAVRNTDHRSDGGQFTYFRTTLADATQWSFNLGFGYSSSIEGYTGTGFSNVFSVVNGLTIGAAARDVRAGGTINVGAGTYSSGTVIATDGVSLIGATGARINATHNGDNGITIAADGVTVSGLEIYGAANQSYVTYAWPTTTRGIVVSNGADNVTVTGNNIHDVRNGILIDGRNANTSLTNNLIDNTKSAISVQYTHGSNLNIAGNREGAFGNEWGVIAYLNGIWNGSSITASAGALGADTPRAEQQRLLALAAANNGMSVYNQGYSAANRTRAYVTTAGIGGAQGSQRTLLNLQGGLDAVVSGGTVYIAGGTYNESVTLNALRVLNIAGPITVAGLEFGIGATGTNIGTSITATGDLRFAMGPVLTGDTTLTARNIYMGTITSPYGLALNGSFAVGFNPADLAYLIVNAPSIYTGGVTTSGVQSYAGNVWLGSEYVAGGDFTVTGLATLMSDVTVSSGGTASLGGVTGASNFSVSGNAIALGAVTGLASLTATGTTIATAGASTIGSQDYIGATTLNGSYSTDGAAFGVIGAATLTGNSSVATSGGNASFGTVTGARDLAVNAGSGTVSFGGAVSGLTGLSAVGSSIVTMGVATSGNQSYTGATALGGSYTTGGGSLVVQGTSTLTGATSIATDGGAATLGVVSGTGNDLGVNTGAGTATIGAASGLGTLGVTGATILTAGAASSGTQAYEGATTLDGAYTASSFTLAGAATLAGDTSVTAAGDASFGTVGGTQALAVGASNVTLGAVSGLTALSATGGSIATNGATTSGAQSYTGATTLDGTYDASAFSVTGSTALSSATLVTTHGGNASFGAVSGTGSLGIDAGTGTVTLGAVIGLSGLSATGASIATGGAATNGAQSFTGATSFNGAYSTAGGAFTVNGAATTVNAVSVATTGGNASFGTIGGAGGLSVNAGTGNVTLGTVNGIASLSATGASIATAGTSTAGAQSYTGATSLNGSYSTAGGAFAVNGAATTVNAVSVATAGGNASFGTVGGAGGLSVNAGTGNVTLGAVTGIASLSATGTLITTAGALTNGAQSYNGATFLTGTYATGGGDFTVNGVAQARFTTVVNTAGGNVTFGRIDSPALIIDPLTIDAGAGNVTLGVAKVSALSVTGVNIVTNGVTTGSSQTYNGATVLNGRYETGLLGPSAGNFTVNGPTIVLNAVSVSAGASNIRFGTVSGTGSLAASSVSFATPFGGGSISIGRVDGIASLNLVGGTITTDGVTTTGGQRYVGYATPAGTYTGSVSLGGAYAAGGDIMFRSGSAILAGDTSLTTSSGNIEFINGNIQISGPSGAFALAVNAGAGNVVLGAVSGLTSLNVTGAAITTGGAATSGAQTYTGATSLNGAYTTGGSAFTVTGATNLAGNTSVTTGNGAASLGAVDAALAGGQGLTLNAGTGSVALGNLGAVRRLGATAVTGGATVLNGTTYAANSLSFTGGTGATVRLTQGTTTFNTTLPGGVGGAITVQPDLVGTANAQQNVSFTAGNGLTLNSGDVAIGNAGSDAVRLGAMTVLGHNFSAATVKLAGTFTSVLSGSQLFSANTLDTLGNVNAIVAGNESGPIRAGGSVTIDAGGSGSGSIIAGGAVNLQYDSNVSRTISSQSNVTVVSLGAIGGSVSSGGAVNLQTTTGAITGAVTATGAVNLGSTSGTIGGSVTAGGAVAITTANGGVTSTVTTPGTATITSQSGAVNATVTGTGGVAVSTNGAITGSYSSTTAIDLTSTRPINVSVNGTVVTVTAPSGTVTGVFGEIHTTNAGTLVVNDQPIIGSGTADARQIIIDTFIIPTRGTVSANGEIQLPAGLALGLIAPAGNGQGGQRPAVVVNNVQRLGELLRQGYTAIVIQLDETNLDLEEELAGQ